MFQVSGFLMVLSLVIFVLNLRLRERASISLGGVAATLLALAILFFLSAWASKKKT